MKADKAKPLYKQQELRKTDKDTSVGAKEESIKPAPSSKESNADAHALDTEEPGTEPESRVHESEPTQSSPRSSRKPSIDGKELEKSSQNANIST